MATSRSRASWIKSRAHLLAFVALAASACSSGSRSSLTLSTTATATDSDAGSQADAGSVGGGISLCDRLLIDRVRLVVRRIDLERAAGGADAGTDGGMSTDAGTVSCDCDEGESVCVKPGGNVHIGPFLVDAVGSELTGGIHEVFDVAIPEGTYEEVRFVINTLSRRQATADGGLSEMKDLHASIAVDGFFAGSPFRFTTAMRLKQKQEGTFEVGPGTKNIILTVDPRSWFVGDDGQLLDPTDPRNRGRILANIRCSVRMSSEDADHEGRSFRREFDDDDRGDRCREDDDDDGQHGDGEHGDAGHDDGDHCGGGDEHHPKCLPMPALVCGDGGSPSPDGGTDGGPDGGPDGG
jgi:hypothetical protein